MSFLLNIGSETERLRSEAETDAIVREMRARGPGPCTAAFNSLFQRTKGEASAPAHSALFPLVVSFGERAALILLDALQERQDPAPDLRDSLDYFQRVQLLRNPNEIWKALRSLLFSISTELEWRGLYPRDAIRNGGTQQVKSWSRRLACLNGPGDLVGCLHEMGESIDSLIEPAVETPKPGRPRKTELSAVVPPSAADDGAAAAPDSPTGAGAAAEPEHILRRKPRQKRN
jgi:hypothetical protein